MSSHPPRFSDTTINERRATLHEVRLFDHAARDWRTVPTSGCGLYRTRDADCLDVATTDYDGRLALAVAAWHDGLAVVGGRRGIIALFASLATVDTVRVVASVFDYYADEALVWGQRVAQRDGATSVAFRPEGPTLLHHEGRERMLPDAA